MRKLQLCLSVFALSLGACVLDARVQVDAESATTADPGDDPVCGNGIVEPGEACDWGDGSACAADCQSFEDECQIDEDGDGVPRCEDCDDWDPETFPGAPEQCQHDRDFDCNGLTGCEEPMCQGSEACGGCQDGDGDGWMDCMGDCDDTDPQVHPGAMEQCDPNIDFDCDGLPGCEDPACQNTPQCSGCLDQDNDGWTDCDGDCDDLDPAINPGAPEQCQAGIDFDCDSLVECADPDCAAAPQCGGCSDADLDGVTDCDGDCDDSDAMIYPGAPEVCGDGRDNGCDGRADCQDNVCFPNPECSTCQDADGDGWFDENTPCPGAADCDDTRPSINPDETEICFNGIDEDCSGLDGDDPSCMP